LISRITELEEANASLRNENTQLRKALRAYQDAVQKASASLASVDKEAR
jgi:regulator of replication initiation timing